MWQKPSSRADSVCDFEKRSKSNYRKAVWPLEATYLIKFRSGRMLRISFITSVGRSEKKMRWDGMIV
jgi:hypothetical protein